MVSRQKGPTRHAYAWQIGPFWQDTLDILISNDKSHFVYFTQEHYHNIVTGIASLMSRYIK